MQRKFAGFSFAWLGEIEVDRHTNGMPIEYLPQSRYERANSSKLHAYGAGPFCKFRMAKGIQSSGLYIVTLSDQVVYVGQCVNADNRWGSKGYGNISPRNPYVGGQPTNCRINAAILQEAKLGQDVGLWFYALSGSKGLRLGMETALIEELDPIWNVAKRKSKVID